MRSLTRLTVALLLVLAGALAACSDDGGGDPEVGLQDREGEEDQGSEDDEPEEEPEDDEPEDEEPEDDGGELPAGAAAYVDAFMATFVAEDSFPIEEDQARCIAEGMVGIITVERLEASGITPEQLATDDFDSALFGLDADEGLEVVGTYDECGVNFYETFLDSMTADAVDPEAMRACIEGTASEDEFRAFMARVFAEGAAFEDSPEGTAFGDELLGCLFGDGAGG